MNTIKDLYEIDQRLEDCVDPETGELLAPEAFVALHMERAKMIDDLASWLKNTAVKATAIKAELGALRERQKAMEARVESLKDLLDYFLDGQKFESARNKVTFRKSIAVNVEDEIALREWAETSGFDDCLRYKTPEINKTAVRDLLKAGKTVPGASLEERRTVVIK